jgi:hypothetical protein
MGEHSPGSREAEGGGGEGFYVARSGRRADLLVIRITFEVFVNEFDNAEFAIQLTRDAKNMAERPERR